MEKAARRSFLVKAQPSSGPARFDLHAVFRSLGATGEPESVLYTADLRQALAGVFRAEANEELLGRSVSFTAEDNAPVAAAADAAAADIAARIVGDTADNGEGKLDYRRFEDWVMPPRDVSQLRGVLVELAEEGLALGLTVPELFEQICCTGYSGDSGGSGGCSGGADENDAITHGKQGGVDQWQLRKGLGALSVYLTETEAKMIMEASGCHSNGGYGRRGGNDPLLSLEMFLNIVCTSNSLDQRPIDMDSAPAAAATINITVNSRVAPEDGRVSPDSLAQLMTPKTPRLELEHPAMAGAAAAAGSSGTSSCSAAAHVEAFGRVATNVQAVLASAVSTDKRKGTEGYGTSRWGQAHSNNLEPEGLEISFRPPSAHSTSPPLDVRLLAKRQDDEALATPSRNPAGPLPRTRAITPPHGPARSPSIPLHPTHVSRELLKAALGTLGTLDLKERLKPTTGGDISTLPLRDQEGTITGLPRNGYLPPAAASSAGNDKNARGDARDIRVVADIASSLSRAISVGGDGRRARGRGRGKGYTKAGTGAVGLQNKGGRPAPAIVGVQSRRGSLHDETRGVDNSRRPQRPGGRDGRPLDEENLEHNTTGTAEMVGRLRARVAELELTEQVNDYVGYSGHDCFLPDTFLLFTSRAYLWHTILSYQWCTAVIYWSRTMTRMVRPPRRYVIACDCVWTRVLRPPRLYSRFYSSVCVRECFSAWYSGVLSLPSSQISWSKMHNNV